MLDDEKIGLNPLFDGIEAGSILYESLRIEIDTSDIRTDVNGVVNLKPKTKYLINLKEKKYGRQTS